MATHSDSNQKEQNDRRERKRPNRGQGGHYGHANNSNRYFSHGGRGGFGPPSNYRDGGFNFNEYEDRNRNSTSNRARPKDKHWEDHMRSSSPDRNERSRPKDKNRDDHARDPSPDRGSNQHLSQGSTNSHMVDQQFYDAGQTSNFGGSHQNQHGQGYDRDDRYFDHDGYYDNMGYHYQNRRGRHNDYYNGNRGHDGSYRNQRDHHQYEKQYQNDQRDNWTKSRTEKSDVHLSKALSFLLRHGAEKCGYKLMSGGFLYVDEILKKERKLQDYTMDDVRRVVENNDKQRFFMDQEKDTGKLRIRANQGHTIEVEDLDLKPITSEDEVPMVIHGTYMTSWEKIKHTGLSRMGRNHIHFAAGEPGENEVISGMRRSCDVMIFIDLKKALADGFEFFRSANNVILSPGNKDGVIPPAYFEKALQRFPRHPLEFDGNITLQTIPGLSAADVKKKKNINKKKGNKDKDDRPETKAKKEKMEVDETAVEGAASLFSEETTEEKMEVDETGVETQTHEPPNKWDEGDDEKFVDAVEEHEEDFKDAEDVIIESEEEINFIEESDFSPSAIDHLSTKDAVAVHCYRSGDTFSRIMCVASDKSFVFDIQNDPKIMTEGKLADFFNSNQQPCKVFYPLDSQTCAIFFEKFDIILDGTKLFDLKLACDHMSELGLGNTVELKKVFNPDDFLPPTNDSNINSICQSYLKGYEYLSHVLRDHMKDYKKQLFQMVKRDIDENDLKKLRDQRKKDAKASSHASAQEASSPSKGKKHRNKKK